MKIGTVTGTSFAVDIQNSTGGDTSRTWYDGVAYVALPEPAAGGMLPALTMPWALRRGRR